MTPATATALATWLALWAGLLGVALGTRSVLAWLGFALTCLIPALMLMVLAHTPDRTAARMMHDHESGR